MTHHSQLRRSAVSRFASCLRIASSGFVALLVFAAVSAPAFAAESNSLLTLSSQAGPGGTQTWSVPIQTLLFFTALGFLPAIVLLMTGFTRIIIVLSLLRHALGTQTTPPNQVLVGLSLFLTFFVMSPTLDKIYQDAYLPLSENKISFNVALERGQGPIKSFMLKQTRETDLALFVKLARTEAPAKPEDVSLRVLVPAFVTSELKTAFQIGFLVFIPFLIIDMVVASVLTSMGMMMLSPVLISLPFKLMLFVLADGWNLLIGSLAASFVT
jgi:flagellar biosynthetic protein FliP